MKRFVLLAVVFLVGFVGMGGFSHAAVDPAEAKIYFLTNDFFDGGSAIKACDTGFHMASISEIKNPNNLRYANRSKTVYDSLIDRQGFGPPLNRIGWVRSGIYPPSGFVYDCDVIKSDLTKQLGTVVAVFALPSNAGTGLPLSPPNLWWQADQHRCSQPEPVWCVEDPD